MFKEFKLWLVYYLSSDIICINLNNILKPHNRVFTVQPSKLKDSSSLYCLYSSPIAKNNNLENNKNPWIHILGSTLVWSELQTSTVSVAL